MKRLLEFFQDGDGMLSAMRLAFLYAAIAIITSSVYISFKTATPMHFDMTAVGLITTLMIGKVTQAYSENSTNNPPKQ